CFVAKMRQSLTFLATIKTDHFGHENVGRNFDSGVADHFRCCIHRPDSDQRSADRAKDEVNSPVAAVFRGVGTMLSVDQFLRLISVPAVVAAFLIASQISAAVTPRTAPMQMASE